MLKENRLTSALGVVGNVFIPLIPAVVASGLCAGFASLMSLYLDDNSSKVLWVIYRLFDLVNVSFLTYMTAWVGYSSAKQFGATPILGGMLGLITSLDGINRLSETLGLYNEASPVNSILCSGRGGIVAVILGVWLLAKIEKFYGGKMKGSMADLFVPMLTLLTSIIPYIFAVMPLAGYVSSSLCWVIEQFCMSPYLTVRIAAGAISAALFLPLVAAGMHMGLSAIYVIQMETDGYISLYPALAMAGAGQVGACLAIYIIAQNEPYLRSVIKSSIPAGVCGVGQPLIYGVTLPLGKPFFAAGMGAIFGGAYVTAMQVASSTWGPSGVLAVFIMTAGAGGPIAGMLNYIIGLGISCIMGFFITMLIVRSEDVAGKIRPAEEPDA